MGDRTYYYVKPKKKRGLHYRNVSVVEQEEESSTVPTPTPPVRILDFQFPDHATRKSKARKSSGFLTVLSAVSLVIALGLLYLGGTSGMAYAGVVREDLSATAQSGITNLQLAAEHLKAQNIPEGIQALKNAEASFTDAKMQMAGLGQANLYLSGLGDDNLQMVTAYKLIDVGLNISAGANTLLTDLSPVLTYFKTTPATPLSQGMVTDIVGVISNNQESIGHAMTQLESGIQILASINAQAVSPEYRDLIVRAQVEANGIENAVVSLGTILQALPDILGYRSSRQYALLNQNNLELRATGGFIGSFALIDLYKGAVEKVSVDVSQRVDGQNKNSSLELPAPLQKVTTSFGTRDANWYFDFAKSAATFQKLYEEAGGGTNDGVIAINPNVIQDLLEITGPLEVGDKQTITADNFLSLALSDTPGDTEHKDLLKVLAPVLLNRLFTSTHAEATALGTSLMNNLRSKDILLYFKDKKLESALQKLNLGGSVLGGNSDYLAVVRSNLGGFKSSQSVKEIIELHPTVDLSGNIQNHLTLEYRHTGTNKFPDGPNKEYVRLLVPTGSRLIELTGSDYGTAVDQAEESGKTVFGFWLTVDPGSAKTVTVTYEPKLNMGGEYTLLLQKQPGTSNTEAIISLHRSPGRIIKDNSTDSVALFRGPLQSDIYRSAKL